MNAGRLIHRVDFLHYAETQDPLTGAVVKGWVLATTLHGEPLLGVPAEVLTGPGREPYLSQAIHSVITARINTRWFPANDREMYKWLIRHDQGDGVINHYQVESVERDAKGRVEWRFKCTDGVVEDGR